MATPFSSVYDAFLGRITDTDRANLSDEMMEADMKKLLMAALPHFRISKIDLSTSKFSDEFEEDLTNDEIQILGALMKREWYERCIADSDVLIQKFGDTDFEFKSQANHLKALVTGLTEALNKEIKKMISNYSRMTSSGKIFDYSKLAGKQV